MSHPIRAFAHSKPFDIYQAGTNFEVIKKSLLEALPLKPVPINAHLDLFADFSKEGIGGVSMFSL